MEKRYKEIDGVKYQVIQNNILGSNVIPVGESLPEVTVSDSGKVLTVNASGEWEAAAPASGGLTLYGPYTADVDYETPIPAGQTMLLTCPYISDIDETKQYTLADLPATGTIFVLSGVEISEAQTFGFGGVLFPYVIDPITDKDVLVKVANLTDASITATGITVYFYTSAPLTEVEVPEEP